MDDYALLMAPDLDDDEIVIWDMGTKAAMDALFTGIVCNGREDGNFYLVRVLKSAEIVKSGDLNVVDHGDEDENNS